MPTKDYQTDAARCEVARCEVAPRGAGALGPSGSRSSPRSAQPRADISGRARGRDPARAALAPGEPPGASRGRAPRSSSGSSAPAPGREEMDARGRARYVCPGVRAAVARAGRGPQQPIAKPSRLDSTGLREFPSPPHPLYSPPPPPPSIPYSCQCLRMRDPSRSWSPGGEAGSLLPPVSGGFLHRVGTGLLGLLQHVAPPLPPSPPQTDEVQLRAASNFFLATTCHIFSGGRCGVRRGGGLLRDLARSGARRVRGGEGRGWGWGRCRRARLGPGTRRWWR